MSQTRATDTAEHLKLQADSLAEQRLETLSGAERARWESTLAALLPSNDLQQPLRVLDVGCGTGFLSVILALLGHEVVGIDSSPSMIQCAYETAAAFGQRIEFRIMNAHELAFENSSFDAVISLELLLHLPDARPVLSEMRRVLKTGGHLIIIDVDKPSPSQLLALGFSHCREQELTDLSAINHTDSLSLISARKPTRNQSRDLPQATLVSRHIQTAKRQIQLYQNWCKTVGLPYPEFSVLNFVSRHSSGARPSDIANALVIPPQTLTRILIDLESAGLLQRATSERDRRSSVISLTPSGLEKISPLQQTLREIETAALASIDPDELASLSAVSERVLKALEDAFRL
jgi:ubiquinone/menaquinone biosynthesis C-methylase UbiE/DNA-binding HxlR family transcriptional regulator